MEPSRRGRYLSSAAYAMSGCNNLNSDGLRPTCSCPSGVIWPLEDAVPTFTSALRIVKRANVGTIGTRSSLVKVQLLQK